MNRLRTCRLLCLAVTAGCGAQSSETPIPGGELALRVTAGVQEIELGKAFPLTVVRVWSKELVPEEWTDRALAPLTVRLRDTTRREDELRVEETRSYWAYTFRREDITVPAPTMRATPRGGGTVRVVSGDEIALRVTPALGEATVGPPELPGELLAQPFSWGVWMVTGAAALAVMALWISDRVRRARRPAVPQPAPAIAPPAAKVSPHARALEGLRRLRARRPEGFEDTQAYFVEASALVREYIEERFALRAREMTTEELLEARGTALALDAQHRAALSEFLGQCDLVKFARFTPPEPERQHLLESAEQFVTTTRNGAA